LKLKKKKRTANRLERGQQEPIHLRGDYRQKKKRFGASQKASRPREKKRIPPRQGKRGQRKMGREAVFQAPKGRELDRKGRGESLFSEKKETKSGGRARPLNNLWGKKTPGHRKKKKKRGKPPESVNAKFRLHFAKRGEKKRIIVPVAKKNRFVRGEGEKNAINKQKEKRGKTVAPSAPKEKEKSKDEGNVSEKKDPCSRKKISSMGGKDEWERGKLEKKKTHRRKRKEISDPSPKMQRGSLRRRKEKWEQPQKKKKKKLDIPRGESIPTNEGGKKREKLQQKGKDVACCGGGPQRELSAEKRHCIAASGHQRGWFKKARKTVKPSRKKGKKGDYTELS